MPGPAPNPNARRRNNRGDWVVLPARCTRPVPAWPLSSAGIDRVCPLCKAEAGEACRSTSGAPRTHLHRARAGGLPPRVASMWEHLWSLPQAEIWHQLNAVRLVARYALQLHGAENYLVVPQVLNEVRQLEDRLLLSPDKLIRARYTIADAEGEAAPAGRVVVEMDEYRDLYGS